MCEANGLRLSQSYERQRTSIVKFNHDLAVGRSTINRSGHDVRDVPVQTGKTVVLVVGAAIKPTDHLLRELGSGGEEIGPFLAAESLPIHLSSSGSV